MSTFRERLKPRFAILGAIVLAHSLRPNTFLESDQGDPSSRAREEIGFTGCEA